MDPDPGDPTGSAAGAVTADDDKNDQTGEEPSEDPDEEVDMSMVDINAAADGYVELSGTVDEYGDAFSFQKL